jgi:hypothetical protein
MQASSPGGGASTSADHHARRMTIVMAQGEPVGISEAIDSIRVLIKN